MYRHSSRRKQRKRKADTKAPAAKSPWVMPRTPDGHPDLHGYWTSLSYTPMERPAKYGNREFLTDQETQGPSTQA